MKNGELPTSWKEIKEYRFGKKDSKLFKYYIWGPIFLFILLGGIYIRFTYITEDTNLLTAFFYITIIMLPGYIYLGIITLKEWKERGLISGVFLILGTFSLTVIDSIENTSSVDIYHGFTRLIIITIMFFLMLFLYVLAPVDLLRIKLRGKDDGI